MGSYLRNGSPENLSRTPAVSWNNRGVTDPTHSSAPESVHDPDWWKTAVIYQIYPRSFADANGDGMGDLQGVVSRVSYLADLGVDAVWLSPFYPSALADGGYDVDDYRDVDPRIGTLDDFDTMITALHEVGIKVLVDIVPNHSSNRHAWFVEALAAPPGSPARHRYIFRDGEGPDGSRPPNDWQSLFGGSVWQPVGDGQWYFHLFAPEQPDLNWDNEEVREDFRTTLRFWADRGVDGFRVDVAHGLVKDLSTPYVPWPDIEMMQRADGSLAAAPAPSELLLTTLLNELGAVPEDVWLVLDDYHLVGDPRVGQGVAFVLEHLPPNVHVVLSTRADPDLPLARWRARRELVEIRAKDLRFTSEETAAYLTEAIGHELTAGDVEVLEERTEGWIAALQLAALSLQGRADVSGFIFRFAGDDRYIVDYLIEEVLTPSTRRRARVPPADGGSRPAHRTALRRRHRSPGRHRDALELSSAPTCSSSPWTTGASGTATTTCSPTCCGRECSATTQTRCRCCTSAPASGTRPTT